MEDRVEDFLEVSLRSVEITTRFALPQRRSMENFSNKNKDLQLKVLDFMEVRA
jgi:hypothetical protein